MYLTTDGEIYRELEHTPAHIWYHRQFQRFYIVYYFKYFYVYMYEDGWKRTYDRPTSDRWMYITEF